MHRRAFLASLLGGFAAALSGTPASASPRDLAEAGISLRSRFDTVAPPDPSELHGVTIDYMRRRRRRRRGRRRWRFRLRRRFLWRRRSWRRAYGRRAISRGSRPMPTAPRPTPSPAVRPKFRFH
jgi:hypothetical protein